MLHDLNIALLAFAALGIVAAAGSVAWVAAVMFRSERDLRRFVESGGLVVDGWVRDRPGAPA